jgi:recyclin-1
VDTGLDRTLNALVGWVRTILATEQKKTDFNPPMTTGSSKHAGMGLAQASPACLRVVKFVNHQVNVLLSPVLKAKLCSGAVKARL